MKKNKNCPNLMDGESNATKDTGRTKNLKMISR